MTSLMTLLLAIAILAPSGRGLSKDGHNEKDIAFKGLPIRLFFDRKQSVPTLQSSLGQQNGSMSPSQVFDSRSQFDLQIMKKKDLLSKKESTAIKQALNQKHHHFPLTNSLSIFDLEEVSTNEQLLPRFIEGSELSIKWREVKAPQNHKFIGTYLYRGKDICGYSLVSNNLESGQSLLLGNYPQILETTAWKFALQSEDNFNFESASLLSDLMFSQSGAKLTLVKKVRDCFYAKNESFVAAKEYLLSSEKVSYRVWVSSDEILNWENLFFEASIEVYEKNILDQVKKIYEIPTDDSGYLTNSKFETRTNNYPRAFETGGVFHYLDSDPLFRETSVFAHANDALDYFLSLGFSDHAKSPLILNVNVVVNGSLNNAIYQPPETTESGRPTISIASGDGLSLVNLTTDIDVVTHELGHHVIFKYLKSTSGESLVLHEGIADFFAFAQTSDPCLGESICPADSFRCWIEGQCLRTADNDIHYGSAQYDLLASHQKSQIVSGLLWDLHKLYGISLQEISLTVMKALSFLNPSSDIQDFISAYALADQFMRAGRDLCALRDVALARGFEEQFSDVECHVLSTWPQINGQKGSRVSIASASSQESSVLRSSSEETIRRKTAGFCAFNRGSEISYFSLILLMLPLWIVIFRHLCRKNN